MFIRRERPDDLDAVRAIHLAAFARAELAGAPAPEARLVDDLRRDGDAIGALSLVADEHGRIVGHVVCSRATSTAAPRSVSDPSVSCQTGNAKVWARH